MRQMVVFPRKQHDFMGFIHAFVSLICDSLHSSRTVNCWVFGEYFTNILESSGDDERRTKWMIFQQTMFEYGRVVKKRGDS